MAKLILLGLAAVAATAIAANTPTSSADCKDAFDKVDTNFASTPAERCVALVTFAKCLAVFPDKALEGKILFSKNEAMCEQYWKQTGAPEIRTRRGDFELSVDDAKKVSFFRYRREEINIFDMNEKLNKVVADMASSNAKLTEELAATKKELAATKASVETQVASDIKKLQDDNAKLKSDTDKAIDGITKTSETAIKDLTGKVTKDLEDASTKRKSALADMDKKLASATKKLSDDTTKAIASVDTKIVEKPIHMWSGGARNHARGQGWRDFAPDRTELNTAAPYFQKISGTKFKALKTGVYEINAEIMGHTNGRCWFHLSFLVDGKRVTTGTHLYSYSWKTSAWKIDWNIKQNQQFWIQVYIQPNCGNPYYWHGGSSWHSTHNRMQVTYKGQLAKKCTSQEGLC